jgi:chemotaxis protein methyltransferase CheR
MKPHVGILDKEERSFEFNQRDFKTVQKLIYEHAGIRLSDAKQDMVYSRMCY